MPVYCYRCHDCKRDFEKRHGMFFEGQRCIFCMSGNVFRLPFGGKPLDQKINHETKTGDIVKKFIKDAKDEVKDYKKELRKEEL